MAGAMKHRRTSTENEDRMPWSLVRVAYNEGFLGKGGLLALGGGYRYADYGQNTSRSQDRWLVAGEAKYVIGPVSLKGELWTGEGLGRNFLRYDLDEQDPSGDLAAAYGGWVDLTFTHGRFSFTAGYGIDNPDSGEMMAGQTIATLNNRMFTKNQQIFGNIWCTLVKPLKVGVEYVRVETERTKAQVDAGDRITLSMQYAF